MNELRNSWIFILFSLLNVFMHDVHGISETDLLGNLFKDYDKKARPTRKPEQSIDVKVKLILSKVVQVVSISYCLCKNWKLAFKHYMVRYKYGLRQFSLQELRKMAT